MKFITRIAVFLAFFGVLSVPCFAADTAASSDASKEAFVKSVTDSILSTVHDTNKSFSQKKSMLQKTFVDVVDIKWIGRFVLGQTWRTTTDDQKTKYMGLYKTYLVNNYVSNFDEESADKLQDIKILGLVNDDDERFIVHTEMVIKDGENVKVDYLVHDDNGSYKVINITIEGVSLLATHRSEFGELAAAGGIDNVIAKLQQMIASKATTTVAHNS